MNFVSTVFLLNMFEAIVCIAGAKVESSTKESVIRCTSTSKAVAACIHTYLEKDFIAISRIVYPKSKVPGGATANERCQNSEVYNKKNHVMMDGPALDNSCKDLKHVYNCLHQELEQCDALGPYFDLRHLLFSLNKVMIWLCGRPVTTESGDPDPELSDKNPHTIMRSRFLVFLESIKCLECVRMARTDCVPNSHGRNETGDVALWNKILRLEVGTEICSDLKRQVECLQNGNTLTQDCGHMASEIHGNLTNLFLETWCVLAPWTSLKSHASLMFNTISFKLVFVCFLLTESFSFILATLAFKAK